MKIERMLYQHRRDFRAVFKCEHCGHDEIISGYDDAFYHTTVIPKMKCKNCNKIADGNYRPLAPKYNDGVCV